MSSTVIVTGASGYIGSHTVVELLKSGFDVVGIDNYSNSSPTVYERIKEITGKEFKTYKVDINDFSALVEIFEAHPSCGVIHFAAFKSVGESVEQPLKYYENNVGGLHTLLSVCDKLLVGNFIFSSSCSVYGNVKNLPVSENSPLLDAESPYAYTKQVGERMLSDFCFSQSEFRAVALRYFNPVGAHVSSLIGESPINKPNNLLPIITGVATGKIEKLVVNGDDYPTRDGTCIRDYIHVTDIAEAHVLALKKLISERSTPNYSVYNLGTGKGVSVMEAIVAFEKVSGVKLRYEMGPRRNGDVIEVYSDSSKALKELGWKPRFSTEDMLKTAWEWELRK